jgi:hypothetical protein
VDEMLLATEIDHLDSSVRKLHRSFMNGKTSTDSKGNSENRALNETLQQQAMLYEQGIPMNGKNGLPQIKSPSLS